MCTAWWNTAMSNQSGFLSLLAPWKACTPRNKYPTCMTCRMDAAFVYRINSVQGFILKPTRSIQPIDRSEPFMSIRGFIVRASPVLQELFNRHPLNAKLDVCVGRNDRDRSSFCLVKPDNPQYSNQLPPCWGRRVRPYTAAHQPGQPCLSARKNYPVFRSLHF